MEKKTVLREIIDYYIKSYDFNGLPIYEMKHYDKEILYTLIDDDLIEAITENEVLNPHIKAFNLNIPKNIQKINAGNPKSHTVFYPTEKALKKVKKNYDMPFTSLLKRGEEQFKIIFFDIEILERYINNPKFLIMDSGYRGKIYPKDEYCDEFDNNDEDYIKDYGMAYIDGEKLHRAVAVFLIDLSNLSPKKQLMWKGFELENQDQCKVESGFVKNLIIGEWVTQSWVFHAIIDEMEVINKQCDKIGLPKLFNKTYGTHFSEMPEGYRNILLPTLKNYYDFVLVLEKMVVHNISFKTFQCNSLLIKSIERRDDNGNEKGSLVMFNEWLNINIRSSVNLTEKIINPLKEIRKIRQVPAHELTNNKYDIDLYQKQVDLVENTYSAMRAIRYAFEKHPLAKDVAIPEYLINGDIVSY
jgi:hypothetical protein